MPPKQADIDEIESQSGPRRRMPNNNELVKDAGKIHLDEAQGFGRGIIQDIGTTVGTHWFQEMTVFNQKTVAVTLLLFISVIAPTLTFGAVYGKSTGQNIGAIETILATSWVGTVYALIGGMPTCIIGSTGPILIFSTVLYNMSQSLGIPYLAFNGWVSIWILVYCLIAGFFDLTRYVKLATRFTDEIFALLIVSIFIMDAVGDPFSDVGILRVFDANHKSHQDNYATGEDYQYLEVALLGTILGFGTCSLIFFFRSFKNTSFFCGDMIRTSIHDFSVTVAVIVFTLLNNMLFPMVDTESLQVPDRFEPTFQCCDDTCSTFWPTACPEQAAPARSRSWIVNLGDLNGKAWAPFAAAGPAVLAFVLVYLDNGITWHLINHKSHNLKHGEAYNWDLVLSGSFNCINGLLGLPWLVATTVPCIIHLNALADKDKDGNFLHVQENRLTPMFAHILVGCCMLALNVLKLLPLPVLYGVFLFMGLSSLNFQFWDRFLLFFMQPSKYPETHYTKHMENSRIHLYTILQIIFFCLVFTVQNVKKIAIAFPLMTLLCIPARLFLFPHIFEGWELLLLDGEDEAIEEWLVAKEKAVRKYENKSTGIYMEEEDDD